MSAVPNRTRLNVPESLKQQLLDFQRRVWSTQMLGAAALAVAGVLIAFLTVFLLDRLWDTPQAVRLVLFVGTLVAWLAIPYALYRWVGAIAVWINWLAYCVSVSRLVISLLSVIELADNDAEQARSRALCAAAIQQVADAARARDLNKAAPPSRARLWVTTVVIGCSCALALVLVSPEATQNAWTRLSAPWRDTPRYTFTSIEDLASHRVVPHGESWPMVVQLSDRSRWEPSVATLEIAGLQRSRPS